MPGLTIHISIGKEYIRKHTKEIKNEKEFIKGTIAPDLNESMTELNKNKSISHYGKWGNYKVKTDIEVFLKDEKVDMSKDYWKGYLLHLLVDHYFYNKCFKEEHELAMKNKDKFYDDYDILNCCLVPRYNIKILDNIKKYMSPYKKDCEPRYLKLDKVTNFIDKMSGINLQEEIEIINKEGMEGLK